MIESIIDFIESDGALDILIFSFVVYLVFLWILIPIWVAVDAYRKWKKMYISIALFLLVLPLNLPAFLFYIIIRPDRPDDEIFDTEMGESHIVNIPVANFVNGKDLVMGIDLRISNKLLKDNLQPDFKLSIESNDETVTLETEEVAAKVKEITDDSERENSSNAISKFFANLKDRKKDIKDIIDTSNSIEVKSEKPIKEEKDNSKDDKKEDKKHEDKENTKDQSDKNVKPNYEEDEYEVIEEIEYIEEIEDAGDDEQIDKNDGEKTNKGDSDLDSKENDLDSPDSEDSKLVKDDEEEGTEKTKSEEEQEKSDKSKS